MSRKGTLSFVLAALTATSCLAQSLSQIEVFADKKYNVTEVDDIKQLKKLAHSVGWEFSPNKITDTYLKDMGINRIRCINIDRLPGEFDKDGKFIIDEHMTTRLNNHLRVCSEIKAIPHLVIGPYMPEALSKHVQIKEVREGIMGNVGISGRIYGPTDYTLYRNYFTAFFEYIIIKKGFKNAVFEAFNEPDIGGGFVYENPGVPRMGSKEAYENVFKNYKVIAEAATNFEKHHPNLKITLGGPALAWAYTFKFGSFNWGNRFVEDCAKNNVKLDFIGVHYYGNISPISGKTNKAYNAYPTYMEMVAILKEAIAKHKPGLPIYMTEYGPSYDVTYRPKAMVNGNNIGAAWNMAFLKAMLETGINTAAYLVTTDIARKDKNNKQLKNVWGWCSYFVNPKAFGYPYPKAPYHSFKMISELKGKRVQLSRNEGSTDVIATVDQKRKTLQLLLWNYAADIPEGKCTIDRSEPETLTIKINNAKKLFSKNPKMISKLIDAENGNIIRLKDTKQPLTIKAASPLITKHGVIKLDGDMLTITFTMPKSSVAMIELGPEPTFSMPDIPYSEEAARLLQLGRLQMKNGENGEALKAFKKALTVADAAAYQKSDALCQLLEYAVNRRDKKTILKTALELMALKNAVPEYLSHALIAAAGQYRNQKKFDKSSELCRKLLGFSYNRYDRMRAELCLGYNLMDQGNYDEAIKMFNEVHKQDYFGGRHYRVPAYLATAMCLFKQKNYQGAINVYKQVLENRSIQGKGSETNQLLAVNNIARCYFALGQPDKAKETLKQAGKYQREIPQP
jgi:predicted negative regulator of RcsB-dependent stress response/beta-xylosidase